jgi:exopolysaccharide production protein ExoZ
MRSSALNSIQLLRAVAVLAVLAHHAGMGECWQFGVDLFFVISGFIIVYSSERFYGTNGWEFFKHRAIRVVPLYWVATLILIVHVAISYDSLQSANLSAELVAASLFFIPWSAPSGLIAPVHAVGWSLNYEFLFYTLFAIALWLSRARAVAAVTAFLFLAVAANAAHPLPLPLGYWFRPIILEFAAGMALALAFRAGVTLTLQGRLALTVCASITFVTLSALDAPRALAWGVPSMILVSAAVLGKDIPRVRFLAIVGDASYSIYLFHIYIFAAVHKAILVSFPASEILSVLASCIGGILIYRLAEYPITRFLKSGPSSPRSHTLH